MQHQGMEDPMWESTGKFLLSSEFSLKVVMSPGDHIQSKKWSKDGGMVDIHIYMHIYI